MCGNVYSDLLAESSLPLFLISDLLDFLAQYVAVVLLTQDQYCANALKLEVSLCMFIT